MQRHYLITVPRATPADVSDVLGLSKNAEKRADRLAKGPSGTPPTHVGRTKIAEHLAGKLDISKKQANQFLDELANLAYREAKNTFTIPGIGKLVVVSRKARMGRATGRGQPIRLPAKRVVRFKVSKQAKDAILGGDRKSTSKRRD